MLKINCWLISLILCGLSIPGSAQELFEIPYEVRERFRDASCDIVIVEKAASTDLGRQEIFVATCSGIETYLSAVMCLNKACHIMR